MADERLLRTLAEQLKLPLVQIARVAELAEQTGDRESLKSIVLTAETALKLVDGLLLSADIANAPQLVTLEPVSLTAILSDTAHKLQPLATQNDCDLELSLQGKYGTVMAHRESLESALLLLGYSMIESRVSDSAGRHQVQLGMHKSPKGLVAGVFDNQPGLSADVLRRGRALYGSARQTMPSSSSANGAGVYIADALMRSMEAPLYVARHNNLNGFAATLQPNNQLQIV